MDIYEWCIIINQVSELFDMVQKIKIKIENEKNLMNYQQILELFNKVDSLDAMLKDIINNDENIFDNVSMEHIVELHNILNDFESQKNLLLLYAACIETLDREEEKSK